MIEQTATARIIFIEVSPVFDCPEAEVQIAVSECGPSRELRPMHPAIEPACREEFWLICGPIRRAWSEARAATIASHKAGLRGLPTSRRPALGHDGRARSHVRDRERCRLDQSPKNPWTELFELNAREPELLAEISGSRILSEAQRAVDPAARKIAPCPRSCQSVVPTPQNATAALLEPSISQKKNKG